MSADIYFTLYIQSSNTINARTSGYQKMQVMSPSSSIIKLKYSAVITNLLVQLHSDDSLLKNKLDFTVASNEGPLILDTWSCSCNNKTHLTFGYYYYPDSTKTYLINCQNLDEHSYTSKEITHFSGSNAALNDVVLNAHYINIIDKDTTSTSCITTLG